MENVHSIPTVGGRVKYIRTLKKYTQDGIAMKAGISQKALSKIELNVTNPSIYRIYRIAESLEVDIYTLIPKERWNAMSSVYGVFGTVFVRLLQWAGKRKRKQG